MGGFFENESPDILGGGIEKICKNLVDKLKKTYNVNTKIVIVENGATVTEIERNFNKIKEHLECMILSEPEKALDPHNDDCDKEISIYLDISNAFRSVPMLVFAATNYLSVLHNEFKFSLDVYCSVRESSVGESKENSVIPMVNITAVSVINQWSMAINEFYDSGSVVKLTQLIQNGEDEWFLDYVTENENRKKSPKKIEIIEALEEFSFAVNSNNLNAFISAVKTIMSIGLDKDKMPVYISDFMYFLVKDFKQRFAVVNKTEVSDFFISYRRRYNMNYENDTDNDGYNRAKGIAEALENEEGRKGKYKVCMDDELKKLLKTSSLKQKREMDSSVKKDFEKVYKTGANLYDGDRFAPVFFISSLPGFRQFAGRFGDHGSRSFSKLRFVPSGCFGISASRYSK